MVWEKAKERLGKLKRVSIHKNWRKVYFDSSQYNDDNWNVYYFKKKNRFLKAYRFLSDKDKQIIKDNPSMFLVVPKYIYDSRYKQMLNDINCDSVRDFFNASKDEEDAYFRYRCFSDWNDILDSESYKVYLICRELLINWCKDNSINYKDKIIPQPVNYIYGGMDLSSIDWYIPTEDRLYRQ